MGNQLCFHCFKKKGDYEVCPHCGYVENANMQQAYQLKPGTVLHKRYIMGTCIGIGGFGITYRAYDAKLHFVVAVKEFYPAGLVNRAGGERKVGIFSGKKEGEFRRQHARFLEEARNMAVFSKEKDIVNVYDFFEENDTAYIIMEYVNAPLLKERLKEGKLPVEEACGYMLALLDALGKVHAQGIIHKDISPDNIFLTGPASIKLFDFGAAKFQGTETERTVSVVVKSGYTPPEQYSAENAQSVYMDIYAAGAVFYEMITGQKPMDALDRIAQDELKKPGIFHVKADEYLERIILKALALEPQMRFQSVQQMKAALVEQKKVKLPEDAVKRHVRRKQLFAAAMAAAVVLAGGIMLLSQTVFSGKGKIDLAGIRPEELTVWLAAAKEDEGNRFAQALLQSIESVCPQVTADVEVIAEDVYAEKLEQAVKQNALPDLFCTDSMFVPAAADAVRLSDYCADLSALLRTIDVTSYIYLDELPKDGDVYALPMALQVGIVYVNVEKEKAAPAYMDVGLLSEKDVSVGYADEAEVFDAFQDQGTKLSQIIGDLSDMNQVEAVTVQAVPSVDFRAIPVLKDGKLSGILKHWYSVKKSGDQNKENAAMAVMSMLLSDGLQSEAYMENDEGIPLNRTVINSYQENKLTTYLSFLREYDLEDIQFYSSTDICSGIREETGGYGE